MFCTFITHNVVFVLPPPYRPMALHNKIANSYTYITFIKVAAHIKLFT